MLWNEGSRGRHHRRRTNRVARRTLDEARSAGLVQRHLAKLRYLALRERQSRAPDAPEQTSPAEAA